MKHERQPADISRYNSLARSSSDKEEVWTSFSPSESPLDFPTGHEEEERRRAVASGVVLASC